MGKEQATASTEARTSNGKYRGKGKKRIPGGDDNEAFPYCSKVPSSG